MKVMRAKRVMMGANNKMTIMRVNLEIKRMINKGLTFSKVTWKYHIWLLKNIFLRTRTDLSNIFSNFMSVKHSKLAFESLFEYIDVRDLRKLMNISLYNDTDSKCTKETKPVYRCRKKEPPVSNLLEIDPYSNLLKMLTNRHHWHISENFGAMILWNG